MQVRFREQVSCNEMLHEAKGATDDDGWLEHVKSPPTFHTKSYKPDVRSD